MLLEGKCAERFEDAGRKPTRAQGAGGTARLRSLGLDLLETTAYMQKEMQSQLEAFDVTMRTIRILEMLYRKGPMEIRVMASQMKCSRQNIKNILLLCEKIRRDCLWRSAGLREQAGRWGSCC